MKTLHNEGEKMEIEMEFKLLYSIEISAKYIRS